MESVFTGSSNFTASDFCVFIFMLLICVGIGLYFGFFQTTKTMSDYLVGGRSLSVFPVAISLVVTNISGIAILGYPTEIYLYGNQYIYEVLAFAIVSPLALKIFLPVFMELNITSTNEANKSVLMVLIIYLYDRISLLMPVVAIRAIISLFKNYDKIK